MGRRPIEEILDEALQSLLGGESAQVVVARYPEYGSELSSLLFAAHAIQHAPQPELPASSLAAIVARAQAEATASRDTLPVIVPPIAAALDLGTSQIERTAAPHHTMKAT